MRTGPFKEKMFFLLSILVFRGLLDYFYVESIAPVWGYSGFRMHFVLSKYLESWLILIMAIAPLKSRCRKPSDFFLLIMFLGVLVPLLSMYGLADKSRGTVYMVLAAYFLVLIVSKGPFLKIPVLKNGYYLGLIIALFFCTLVVGWFLMKGGLSRFNLDLSRVYEFRRGPIRLYVGVMGYIINWTVKVFSLSLFAVALNKKRYFMVLLVFLMQVFFFGVSSHKAILFYPGLVLLVYFAFRKNNILLPIPFVYSLVIGFSYLATSLTGSLMYVSLFIRRTFFVIANNTFDYFEFFARNPKVYWSDHLLSSFIRYPYHTNPSLLIGEWQGTESWVNNTFLSTGFMHAGLWGLVFYAFLFALLLRFVDSLSKNFPLWFSLAIIIAPMYSLLTSADFFTALLTHGVAVSCLMLWLLGSTANTENHQTSANSS